MMCERCNGSGQIGFDSATCSRERPGPVPDDTRGWDTAPCPDCRGSGSTNEPSETPTRRRKAARSTIDAALARRFFEALDHNEELMAEGAAIAATLEQFGFDNDDMGAYADLASAHPEARDAP